MLRAARFHATMARLALVAALLLAVLPTLGRLAPRLAEAAQVAQADLVALCTAQGLEYVDPATLHTGTHAHPAGDAGHGSHGGAPEQPHDHNAPDCAYCPLLLSLLVASAWLLWLRAGAARGALPTWPARPTRAFVHPCGLGSRGPPRACLRA